MMISAGLLDQIITYIGSAVYFGGAVLLFVQSLRGGPMARARLALAFILVMWGSANVAFGLQFPAITGTAFHPMSVLTLLSGNLYIIISLLYPLELARPGWIDGWHTAQLLLPFLVVSGLYFLVLGITGEQVLDLSSVASLLTHSGQFNVWYRFVLYLSICFYLVYMFMHTSVMALDAHPLPGDDSPQHDRTTLMRLRIFGAGMLFISLAYLMVLLFGSPVCRIAHRILSVTLFGIITWSAARGNFSTAKSPATP